MVLLYDNCLAAASKYKAAKAFHIFTRDVGSIKKKIHGQIIDTEYKLSHYSRFHMNKSKRRFDCNM